MSLDRNFFEDLIIQEICGTISPSDEAILKDAIDKDPELWRLREEMMRMLQTGNVAETRKKLRESITSKDIIRKAKSRRRIQRMQKAGAIAAVICMIVFFSARYIPFSFLSSEEGRTVAALNEQHSVVLQLPDGNKITLDSGQQQLQTGSVVINTRRNTLSYQAAGIEYRERAILIVPPGKDYKIKLNDGSEIHLNSGTRLVFPLQFSGGNREITVDGEAYLTIASQPDRPFLVHLPQGTVQVLGTSFNINTYDSGVQKIALVNGAVKVKMENDSLILKPGMEAVATGQKLTTATFDPSEVLAWREGKYYIDDARLDELSRVLTRWYGITVVIDNKKAAEQRFTGIIDKTQDIEVTLQGLKLTNLIDYYKDSKGVIHIR